MSKTVKAALIGGIFVLLAAIVTVIFPYWWRPGTGSDHGFTIAGTVVDQNSNRAVGQALVSVEGHAEHDVSEDNGNFRIDLQENPPTGGIARVHVTKPGYLPYDVTTRSTESLTIQLRKK